MEAKAKGIAVGPGEGQHIRSPIGGDITFIVRGERSNGALATLEGVAPAGEGPPLHVHGREDETVYILEGDFRWKLGDELSSRGPSHPLSSSLSASAWPPGAGGAGVRALRGQ